MTVFTRDDYTVAWICALPLEMAAAKAMLDELHAPLSQPPTNHNTYTLSTLSGHNVVIACLPSGVYGTTSAGNSHGANLVNIFLPAIWSDGWHWRRSS